MKRVLIIDDQESNRVILRELLGMEGWTCTEAGNGVEGLSAVHEARPDLVLTDYEMPEMDGLELLENLKSDPSTREIPVIIITARLTDNIRKQALNMGAETVLPKPFEFEVLFKSVGAVVAAETSHQAGAALVRPMEILLVEDNEGDVRLTREALKEVNVQAHLSVVNDGEEAMVFLRRQGLHARAGRPDLILLDLNLPKKGGHEVLAEVKADRELQSIPVVILSSSSLADDITKSHERYANCYVTKPTDLTEFWKLIKDLVEFWLVVARIPVKY